jgi:hypothetical protein
MGPNSVSRAKLCSTTSNAPTVVLELDGVDASQVETRAGLGELCCKRWTVRFIELGDARHHCLCASKCVCV